MARWENANLEGLNLPDPEKKVYTFFGASGKESKERDAFVKVVDNGGFMTYYIKYGRGDLLDPLGADRGKHSRPYFDFKKVTKDVYNYYMQYITNSERIFLTRARRALMEIN
jgi:hypothetical protein